ncbi:NPCBM/NEW2 domain-containing protein [Amycolatopsis sp. H20-H5]|uniref:NPCBM/NEW2 domain-containing protein n=1 Tax=Amycolatopsis sp. H20-H5 TaxID=3046309 RepID=UPI002DB83774|nr:NPCBM/NEW2 domain-containing protein [Amycolatopsis sp. H20-H5]MEC3982146.1 NPCBM/NEW2 domain-containing protein [Amycolatopsis sp. H20-H5]
MEEIPSFLNAHSTTRYVITEFTMDGISELLVAFTGVARFTLPKMGPYRGAEQPKGQRPNRTKAPSPFLLTTTLEPVTRGSDIQLTGAEIDGLHRGDSIVYQPSMFAHEPRGVIEYNLARRFSRFEAVGGVLDDAAEAGQTGYFQVFLDGVAQPQAEVRIGKPAWIAHDVTGTLRLRLVAYRAGTTVHPMMAGAMLAGGRSNKLPALAWGNPTLFE